MTAAAMNVQDLVILGGGLAGLSLALQLSQSNPDIRIAVIERESHPVPEAAHKVGESTVELGAFYLREVLGLAEHLKHCQLRKLGIRIFFSDGKNNAIERRVELGANEYFPTGTHQVDRGRLENHLACVCRERGINFIDGARVKGVTLSSGGAPHKINFDGRSGVETVAARWLVDASGKAGILKKKLGLERDSSHAPNAAWCRLATKINIDEWSDDPNWRSAHAGEFSRWFSTNHLMGPGYWVWIIPLASDSTSIGIVADPALHPLSSFNTFPRMLEWLRTFEPQCARAVEAEQHSLQDFIARKHYSHWCAQVFSSERWAITGDAGIFIDPLYSPGTDFIALANTYITDLVTTDLGGKVFAGRAEVYNDLYLSFARNTFSVFHEQYPILGNAAVMSTKVFWDYATYWSFFAFLFINGRICDVRLLGRFKEKLAEVSSLNYQMQEFFRRWAIVEQGPVPVHFIDLRRIKYLYDLNASLKEPLDDSGFEEHLHERIIALVEFAAEIISRAVVRHPQLEKQIRPKSPVRSVLSEAFEAMNL